MRAFVIPEFGGTGSVTDRPTPEPTEGQVLIRVHAAGVNAMDTAIVSGAFASRMEHRLPLIPGLDVSGVVQAVGPGVQAMGVGDAVFGNVGKRYFGEGTFGEFVTANTSLLVQKPAGLTHTLAAALPTAGAAAAALVDAVDPRPGQTVVIVGAGGGVGSFATELAARAGAHVVAVTRGAYADQVRGLGATDVIDYTAGDVAEAVRVRYPGGVDAIIDIHSQKDELTRIAQSVKAGGRVASILRAADEEALAQRGVTAFNVGANYQRLGDLGRIAEQGELRVPITTYSLADAGRALAEQATGHTRGKLIVIVD